jgi:hypothetical protein
MPDADAFQISQSSCYLIDQQLPDLALPVGEHQSAKPGERFAHPHRHRLGDVPTGDSHGERFGLQPSAAAGGAGVVAAPAAEEDADVHLVLPPLQPAEKAVQPAKLLLWHAFPNEP